MQTGLVTMLVLGTAAVGGGGGPWTLRWVRCRGLGAISGGVEGGLGISSAWVLLTTECEFWDPKGSFSFSILVPGEL